MEADVIKALCNPIRLKLIRCISKREKTVGELISNCGLSQSAVSQHLIKLKKAGFVKDSKEGREVKYSLTNKDLSKISNLLLNLSKEKNI
jgi:DNA-binding transcriptional ArsR family regulator